MSTAATPGELKIFLQRLKRALGTNPDAERKRNHETGCCQREAGWEKVVCMVPKRARDAPGKGRAAGPPLQPSVYGAELAGPTEGPCLERKNN